MCATLVHLAGCNSRNLTEGSFAVRRKKERFKFERGEALKTGIALASEQDFVTLNEVVLCFLKQI